MQEQPTLLGAPEPTKACTKCGQAKPLSEFPTYMAPPHRAGKPREGCKPCMRAYANRLRREGLAKSRSKAAEAARHVLRFYRLDASRYGALVPEDGRCPICQEAPSAGLQVDHDHRCCPGERSCGECVRGLLCGPCNRALAQMRDDPERLRRAAEYLEAWEGVRQAAN
jgi:hypothetical protein